MPDVLWKGFSRAPCCCPGCPAGLSLSPQLGESSTPGAWGLWPAASPESRESLHFPSYSCAQSLYLFPTYLSFSRLMVEWTLSINNCHLKLWHVEVAEAKIYLQHHNRLHLLYEVCAGHSFMTVFMKYGSLSTYLLEQWMHFRSTPIFTEERITCTRHTACRFWCCGKETHTIGITRSPRQCRWMALVDMMLFNWLVLNDAIS